jgi:hypothetical protein
MIPVVRVTKDTISLKLRRLTPAVINAAEKSVAIEMINLAAQIKQHFGDNGLHRRTGALSRSIVPGPLSSGRGGVTSSVLAGQKLPYARIQEFGGTIRPVHAQYLAIPLDAVKTAGGVARFGPRDASQAGYDTFIRNNIIFGKRDGEVTPLFLLKKEVTIPARPYFWPTVNREAPGIIERVTVAISEAMRAA